MAPHRSRPTSVFVLVSFVTTVGTPPAFAQHMPVHAPARVPVARTAPAPSEEPTAGLELEVHGTGAAHVGRTVLLRGVAYRVVGLAALHAAPRATVTAHEMIRGVVQTQTLGTTTTDGDGRFVLSFPATSQISIELVAAGARRSFGMTLAVESPDRMDLLTDRTLYEPGETIHAWVRLLDAPSRSPRVGVPVSVALGTGATPAGRLGVQRIPTSAAGVAALDTVIPANAPDGPVSITARVDDPWASSASVVVRVGRRTVERLVADTQVDPHVVAPGGRVTGHVTVRTPSGTPVRDAQVEIRPSPSDPPITVTTDAQGVARFAFAAPAYLDVAIQPMMVDVRVVHRVHGTVRTAVSYVLARAPFAIEAIAGAGGIVPEVESPVYLTVTDPQGMPPHAGTHVRATGPGIVGTFQGTTDVHGLVALPMRLPRGAAARFDQGACAGSSATAFDATVEGDFPASAHLCVRVSTHAEVIPRVAAPIVTPGGTVEVALERRPVARARALVVDLLHRGDGLDAPTVLTSEVVPAGANHVSVRVPTPYLGPLLVRARTIGDAGEPEGTGAFDAVLSRPAHAFALDLHTDHPTYHVRDTAQIVAHVPAGVSHAHLALVARDLAADAGEQPFALAWLRGVLNASAIDPNTPEAERLVRTALAALLSTDSDPVRAAPLVVPLRADDDARARSAGDRGDLRDPQRMRDELLRRGLDAAMRALEGALDAATSDAREGIVTPDHRAFDPRALERLVADGQLDDAEARTLGGERMTVGMLEAVDGGFRFEHVARVVARRRLVHLLATLAAYVDPGSGQRSRAQGVPPDRWLSQLVASGSLAAGDLHDPWGGTFALRRVNPGHESVAIAVAASGWELASAGPDRVLGTADDMRNPFERVVPADTVYAVSSGEDGLMERLASLAPGNGVLTALAAAYRRVGRGVPEETVGDTTTATASDAAPAPLVAEGATSGGERSRFAMAPRPTAAARAGLQAPESQTDDRYEASDEGGAHGGLSLRRDSERAEQRAAREQTAAPRTAQLAALVRERFPATLRFVAESEIDASGTSTLALPLADALTTYRVEAIAWTDEGWTTSASTDVPVDQDAVVDAPVPPFASVGDLVRLPVRVSNRTTHPIRARVAVTAEGDLHLDVAHGDEITVPPGDATEAVVLVRMTSAGRGMLVASAVEVTTGNALDATRRPLEVLPDARPVRMAADALVDGHAQLVLEVPSDATYRADGAVRVTVGAAIFGDPRLWGPSQPDVTWPVWAIAMGGGAPTGEMADALMAPFVDDAEHHDFVVSDPALAARAVSGAWFSERATDDTVARALMGITRALEGYERLPRATAESAAARDLYGRQHTDVLLALAPAFAGSSRRASLAEPLRRLITRLRRSVESNTAASGSDAARFASASAALALTGGAASPRVVEFMRRAARGVVRLGDDVSFEAGNDAIAQVDPSAMYALAAWATGDRETAFAIARTLGRSARSVSRWPLRARALATAVMERLTPTSPATAVNGSVRIVLDGHAEEVAMVHGVATLASAALSRAGRHRVEISLPVGTTLVAEAEARYGRPWNDPVSARAPLVVSLEGPIGARDARAGLVLRVQNHGPRVVASPVIELDMPAGAELDEETRRDLQRRTGHTPVLSGRTLVLTLRALAPGGFARVPIALRWSVGGDLRGLGVAAYVSEEPGAGAAVIPSRAVSIPDRGPEPSPSPAPTVGGHS